MHFVKCRDLLFNRDIICFIKITLIFLKLFFIETWIEENPPDKFNASIIFVFDVNVSGKD